MRWPWIARVAYDDLREDRDHWRTLAERLQEHVARLERVTHGLPEREPPPRMKLPNASDFPALFAAAQAWSDPTGKLAEATRELRAGKSEATVLALMQPEAEE